MMYAARNSAYAREETSFTHAPIESVGIVYANEERGKEEEKTREGNKKFIREYSCTVLRLAAARGITEKF